MSYCRFSTDDFKCDLYIYEHVNGSFVIHTAGSRLTAPISEAPEMRDHEGMAAYLEWSEKNRVDIDHPNADQMFSFATPGEAALKALSLFRDGFRVPTSAIRALLSEQSSRELEYMAWRREVIEFPGNEFRLVEVKTIMIDSSRDGHPMDIGRQKPVFDIPGYEVHGVLSDLGGICNHVAVRTRND